MQEEQDISASALVRVYLLGPLEISKRDTSGNWKLVPKEAENQGHISLQALPLLERALALLERGELLEGEDGKWCHAFRKRAEDMLRQARLWLAESYETQGKLWQAGEQYRAMMLREP